MRYCQLLTVLFALFATSAYAQTETPKTPREQIIHNLSLDVVKEKKAVADDLKKDVAKIETIIALRGSSSREIGAKTSLDNLLDAITAEIVTPKKPEKVERIIAPFYLSAQDYLDMRGVEKNAQLVLHYEVANGAASGTGLGTIKDVKLIFGEGFAAMKVDKNLTIYDFKLDRILSIKPEYSMDGKTSGKLLFENTSIYAKVYRDITAVGRATNNGRIKKLDMGQGTTLDAFWVESSMSWAGSKSGEKLAIKKSDTSLEIKRGGEIIFSAEFMDEEYEDENAKNSMFAFAHHEWPLHPSALRALYAYDAPPKWFKMLSYGPTAPKGQKQVWTLVKRENIDAEFPLSSRATGTAQGQQVSPLVFLINEAVHNRALGGIQSVEKLTQEFNAKMDMEAHGQAWIVGQKYMAYSGDCHNPYDLTICKAVTRLEKTQKDDFSTRIQDYIKVVSFAQSRDKKGDAIAMVKPYLDKKETPAFIIRTAAMARAKMKKSKAKAAGVVSINAENLLQTALAKDPYDPNTYVGFAQVLAAKGAFEQSWDIYDALRAGIPTVDSLEVKITRLEEKLRNTAPGYFLEQ